MAPVIMVEPQCTGFAHVQFNAALLATLQHERGDRSIEFWAEPEHAALVTGCLATHSGFPVTCRDLGVKGGAASRWARFAQEHRFYKTLLARAAHRGAKLVVFSSVGSSSLIALKLCLQSAPAGLTVLAVAHSVLAELLRNPKRFWNYPLSIKVALRLVCPSQLKLIALSAVGASSTKEVCPCATMHALDHPYLFTPRTAPVDLCSGEGRSIRIGVLGRSPVPCPGSLRAYLAGPGTHCQRRVSTGRPCPGGRPGPR